MGVPIKFESPRRSAREELLERLDQAPATHAEALLAVYDLLQGLHDRGVLDALNGALSSGNFILDAVVETANTPENIRAIRNLLILSKVLSDIDPDVLGSLVGASRKHCSRCRLRKQTRLACCSFCRSLTVGTPVARWPFRPAYSRAWGKG